MFKKETFKIFALGVLAVLSHWVQEIINEFDSYDVDTSVTLVTPRKLQFPDVTVCNMNLVRRSALPDDLQGLIYRKPSCIKKRSTAVHAAAAASGILITTLFYDVNRVTPKVLELNRFIQKVNGY